MNTPKKEPWRIVAAVLGLLFIAFLWIKKDIVAVYASIPDEQLAPMIATTVAVSLLKIGALTGGRNVDNQKNS